MHPSNHQILFCIYGNQGRSGVAIGNILTTPHTPQGKREKSQTITQSYSGCAALVLPLFNKICFMGYKSLKKDKIDFFQWK
jgi:hypothetical protein